MESEKRLKAKISVLEYLTKNKTLYDRDGMELAGDYWYDIKVEVNGRCKGNFFRGTNSKDNEQEGGIDVLFTEQVYAFLAECKDRLDELENNLYDRELTREAKKNEYPIHKKGIYHLIGISSYLGIISNRNIKTSSIMAMQRHMRILILRCLTHCMRYSLFLYSFIIVSINTLSLSGSVSLMPFSKLSIIVL